MQEELDAKVVELDEALAAVDDKAADMEGVNDGQCDAIEDANAILEALVQRLEAAGLEVPPEVNDAIAALGAELEEDDSEEDSEESEEVSEDMGTSQR